MESKTHAACRTCQSEHRHLIETLIARGASLPAIVEKINAMIGDDASKRLNRPGLQRHKARHLGTELAEQLKIKSLSAILGKGVTLDELRTQESENWLAHMVAYRAELDTDINTAREAGDLAAVSSLSGRRNRLLETLGRWLGELGISTQVTNVSLHTSPDFLELRRVTMEVLKPFPDVRRLMAKAYAELGRRKPDPEIIDVVSTPIISGAERDVTPTLPQGATEAAPATQGDQVVCSVPAVVKLGEFSNGRTTER